MEFKLFSLNIVCDWVIVVIDILGFIRFLVIFFVIMLMVVVWWIGICLLVEWFFIVSWIGLNIFFCIDFKIVNGRLVNIFRILEDFFNFCFKFFDINFDWYVFLYDNFFWFLVLVKYFVLGLNILVLIVLFRVIFMFVLVFRILGLCKNCEVGVIFFFFIVIRVWEILGGFYFIFWVGWGVFTFVMFLSFKESLFFCLGTEEIVLFFIFILSGFWIGLFGIVLVLVLIFDIRFNVFGFWNVIVVVVFVVNWFGVIL